MNKLILILTLCVLTKFVNSQPVTYYPGHLQLQKFDSSGREVFFLSYDTASKTTTIRGDFKQAIAYIGEYNKMNADLVLTGARIAAQITNTGTVRNRAALTQAIFEYNQVKLKYGLTW